MDVRCALNRAFARAMAEQFLPCVRNTAITVTLASRGALRGTSNGYGQPGKNKHIHKPTKKQKNERRKKETNKHAHEADVRGLYAVVGRIRKLIEHTRGVYTPT